MAKCILLVRVSTTRQELETQEKELYQMALKDGYKDSDIIPICEKESGIKLSEEERVGLIRLKEVIATEDVDCVYLWEVSRLGRKKKVIFSILDFLISRKIQLIVNEPSIKLLKKDGTVDAGAETIFTLYAQMAESEMREKKARFKRAKKQMALDGKYVGGYVRYGYKLDADNNYIIDEEQAKFVRLIYNLYESGRSAYQILVEIKERGFVGSIHLVRSILQSKAYIGYSDEYGNMRHYPIIISKEQYDKCREIAKNNYWAATKVKETYLCYKKIICTNCGAYFQGKKAKKKYFCARHLLSEKDLSKNNSVCSNSSSFLINHLDSLVWCIAKQLYINNYLDEKNKYIGKYKSEIQVLNEKINAIDIRYEENNKLKKRAAKVYMQGLLDDEEYQNRLNELNQLRNDITNDRVNYQQQIDNLQDSIRLAETVVEDTNQYFIEHHLIDVQLDNASLKKMYDICQMMVKKINIETISRDIKQVKIWWNYQEEDKPMIFNFKPYKQKCTKWFLLDEDNTEYPIEDIYGDGYVFLDRF